MAGFAQFGAKIQLNGGQPVGQEGDFQLFFCLQFILRADIGGQVSGQGFDAGIPDRDGGFDNLVVFKDQVWLRSDRQTAETKICCECLVRPGDVPLDLFKLIQPSLINFFFVPGFARPV